MLTTVADDSLIYLTSLMETTLKTLAQTRSEQTVYHYRVGRQFRKLQLILDLYEIDLTARRKHLVAERPAVERQHLAADIEQIHRRTVALTHHYGGYRQSVGTIIAHRQKTNGRVGRHLAMISSAMPRAARFISSRDGMPSTSMVRRSIALTSSVVNIFIDYAVR